jgi:hypothetical protein
MLPLSFDGLNVALPLDRTEPNIMRYHRPLLPTFFAAAAVAVLAAGCGGGSSPASSARPTAAAIVGRQFVAFAVCMRSHGVPGYPDPEISSSGNHTQVTISPGSADPNSPAFKSADHACHNLMPNGGMPVNSAQDQAQDLTFADCMRAHRIPNFPDADRDGAFTLPSTIDQQAPQFQRATKACANVEPSSLSILNQPPGPS